MVPPGLLACPSPGLILTEPLPKITTEQSDFFVNYFKALAGEEDFLVKPEEVRRVLAVMEVCHLSAKTKQSVDFE